MPTVALTDITLRNLKPVPGKRVTYLDKTIKGFGVSLRRRPPTMTIR